MASSSVTSIGTSASSLTGSPFAVSGLSSGMNWQTIVQELGTIERAPETQWQNQQVAFNQKNAAYTTVATDLTNLQLDAQTLLDPSFYRSVVASSSASSVATVSAAASTTPGSYVFNISQLATPAQMVGNSNVSQVLDPGGDPNTVTVGAAGFATPVTAGTFTVNGATVNIATTDSLQTVFNNISSATGGKVTASYNATTDKISLASSDGSAIVLGSTTDTSNFLGEAQLYNDNGSGTTNTGTITSTAPLGHLNMAATLNASDTQTTITDGGSGNGAFTINGVTINYNASSDTLQNVLNNINASAAGVSAAYDPINNRFVLANKSTGDVGISMQDVTGNFLAVTGLSGGTLKHGQNLVYTLNGSSQNIVSQSNTIGASSSGITGLTVTALAATTGSIPPVTVTVGADTAGISTAIQKFVTDYNTTQSYISSQMAVTTAPDGSVTAGTLTGDTNANDIVTTLRSMATAVKNIAGTSGAVKTLADLGFQSNGHNNTIALANPGTLTSALTNSLNDVKALFSDPTYGLAVQLNKYITATISPSGTLTGQQADLTKQSTDITTQISNLENKIASDTAMWNSEFTNMETATAASNQQLTYLSQGVANGSL